MAMFRIGLAGLDSGVDFYSDSQFGLAVEG